MITLNNGIIEIAFDERANLVSLRNLETGYNWAGNCGLWRIIYEHGHVQEEELLPGDSVSVRAQNDQIHIDYTVQGFKVSVAVWLDGDQVHLDAELINESTDRILREFQFPLIGNVNLNTGTEFLWTHLGGERFADIPAALDKAHTLYMGQDNKALERSTLYPGLAAANCIYLSNTGSALGIFSCDLEFRNTLHLLRKRQAEIDATMVKYPFLKPGEKTVIGGYRLAVVNGGWHHAADHYRAWCDTWMRIPEKPDSIRNSNGWHRLIMRHQYGKQLFHYKDLPAILKSGLEAGIDTLFMFGWHAGGHDSCYPEYDYAEDEGGFAELKKQIAAFQAGGGHVNLYFNGQLIDMNTEFYRTTGRKISVKLPSGQEHMEVYPFGGDGTALRQFGNKVFVTACPASREWWCELKKMVDIAIDLGCDGVFFDQLGYLSRPCCDPAHGHDIPFMNVFKTKAGMIAEIRQYIKARKPEMSFGIEWFNDVTAQHVDYLHNISGGAWKDGNQFFELSRYLFPEVLLSDREIRDDTDVEYRVNHAIRLGYISDVEIYRCRALIDETPHYKAYLTRANAFRDRNRELILHGKFRDTVGVKCDNPAVEYALFESGNQAAVVACTPRDVAAEATIEVPGMRYCGFDTIDGTAQVIDEQVKVKLAPASLILLKYRKNEP